MWENLNINEIAVISNVQETISDETSLANYQASIKKLTEKKQKWEILTTEDKKILQEARNFANSLESKKDASEVIKKQSKELLKTLADLSEEKNKVILSSQQQEWELQESLLKDENRAIIEYLWLTYNDVKDLNLSSALDMISKWKTGTDYDSWKQAWYIPDGFFGPSELSQLNSLSEKNINKNTLSKYLALKNQWIKLIDVANTKLILDKTSPDEIYKVLFDVDNNLEVSQSDNQNIIKFKDAYEFVENMLENWKEKELLLSIWNILWQTFANRKALYNYVKENPDAKYKLLKNITLLAWAGNSKSAYVSDVLQHGKEATKVSLDKKSKVDKYINDIFDKEKVALDEKYNTAISEFEKNIPEDKKEQYAEVVKLLKSTEAKKSIFENMKLNGVWILASLVEWKKWLSAGTSFSHKELDSYLKEKTQSIISWVNMDVWFANIGGKMVPWIWASVDLSHDISEETRAFGKVGIINIIPYAMAGIETQLNADEIKKMWFVDLTKKAQYAGASVNVSSLGWWAALHYRKDQLKGIEQKEKQFSEFLNSALTVDKWVDMSFITSMPDYETNTSYYDTFAKNIKDVLNSQNFNSLPPDYKKAIISSLKTSATFAWREKMLQVAEQNGYEFSGIWVGVQFLSWFMPLPTFGIAFEKTSAGYSENQVSRLYATLQQQIGNKKVKTPSSSVEKKEERVELIDQKDFVWEVEKLGKYFNGNTRYNLGAEKLIDPKNDLETRWSWLKQLSNRVALLKKSWLKNIIATVDKNWSENQKLYVISTVVQFMKTAHNYNNGDIKKWNSDTQNLVNIDVSRRKSFDTLFGTSMNSEAQTYYKWLVEAGREKKISKVNSTGLAFDATSTLNVEWKSKSIKWVDVFYSNLSMLAVNGKPLLVPVDSWKNEAFIKNLSQVNMKENVKQQLINGINDGSIKLYFYKDPEWFDDRILPIKTNTPAPDGEIPGDGEGLDPLLVNVDTTNIIVWEKTTIWFWVIWWEKETQNQNGNSSRPWAEWWASWGWGWTPTTETWWRW